MHTGVMLAVEACHGVACFVVSGQLLFLGGHDTALLFGAGHDLHGSFLNVLHRDGLAVAAGCQQGGLVDQIFQISARKTGGALCNDLQGNIGSQGFILGVNFEDLFAALDVRKAHIDLTVKTARAQQCLIQNVGTVGSSHDDNAIVGLKAVHLHQQLVQGLLTLVVTAAQTGTALTAHRIDLIDEDNAGHGLFGLVEQIAHAGSTHADVHLHKVGTGDGVERHTGLACAGTGQQGLTGTRRAHQQNAMGDAGTQRIELVRALEELDDLFQFFLFLVLAGNIGKGSGFLVLMLVLDLGLADVHDPAAASAAAHHGEQQKAGTAQHAQIEQNLQPWDALFHGGVIIHHGLVRVGCIILIDVVADMADEHGSVRQLVAHRHRAVVVLLSSHRCVRRGQHPAQQSAGGLGDALGSGVGQGQFAFLQVHGQHAGVQIQRELFDLQVFKVLHRRGIGHGGSTAAVAAAAQHRPHHQHSCQSQR